MTTVVLEQAELRLSLPQVLALLKQLSPAERAIIRSALDLDEKIWRQQFERIVAEIRAAAELDPNPIADEEITAEVEAVRDRNYAEGRH